MELTENGHGDINNNQSIGRLIESRYKLLVEEGSCEVGVDPDIDPSVPPPWFDRERFDRAQQTASKYFLSLKWSSFSGLLLGIQVPIFLEPLLVTGQHETVSKLFKRYLDTETIISYWYTTDPFDESSEAYRSLRLVRSMHKSVFKQMNQLDNRVIGQSRLWVSQFQMAITQAGFFGLLITHTTDCFAHGITDSELEDIIYLWRVLGYLNGVQDKYNICNGNLMETRAYLDHINHHFVAPQISMVPSHPYPIGYQVAQGIAEAFRPVQPNIRWQVYLTYWYDKLGIPLGKDWKLSWFHRMLLRFTKFTFQWLLRVDFIYRWANERTKSHVTWAKRNCSTIQNQLESKYNNRFQANSCPYSITLDSLSHLKVDPLSPSSSKPLLDDNQNPMVVKSKVI